MADYKLWKENKDPSSPDTKVETGVIRTSDNAWIPKDTANTDYAEYLEWVAAGNTAEAAD